MSDGKQFFLNFCFFGLVSSYNIPRTTVSHSLRISRQVEQCVLPQYPNFGQWLVYKATSQPNPGTFALPGTILQISCKHGYKLEGEDVIVCIDGKWSTEIGECVRTEYSSYNFFYTNVGHFRISRQVQECVLPVYPNFGHWHVYLATFQPIPGTVTLSGTILKVSCQNGYKLVGVAVIVCVDGRWSTEIGECLKTCPPIYNTSVMTVSCTYNHRKLKDCVDTFTGTVARFRCVDFYEDQNLERHSRHVCYNGKWSHNIPECVPICGQKNVRVDPTAIVGGINATRGEYPWQMAIYDKQSKILLCGGSLINERVVLTAAHCITDVDATIKSKELFIVAGGKYYRNYDDSRDANESQFSSIFEMYISKQYKADVQNFFGDIAVIITKKTFILSTRIRPVCVDWAFNYMSTPSKTQPHYVTGWGYTVEYEKPSEVLKELQVPLITEKNCKDKLPDGYTKYLTDDKLCAGYLETGLSVCKGDSGGGLVTKYRDRYYVIGIVSITALSPTHEGGCYSQQYSLYTNVSYYIDSFLLNIEARFRTYISYNSYCEDDSQCETETTTPQPRDQIHYKMCTLPEHPLSGKWIITGSQSKYSPGKTISTGTIIQIVCDQHHNLHGEERILCDDQGKWSQEIGKCLGENGVSPSKIDSNSYESEVQGMIGDQVTLYCAVNENPTPKITWRKDNVSIDGTQARHRIKLDQSLQIITLHETDAGIYLCTADNNIGEPLKKQIKLNVVDSGPRPSSILKTENQDDLVVSLNQSATLNCLALGYPFPIVTWWYDDSLIPLKSNQFEIREDYSLFIQSVQLTNLGTYTCQAYNGIGKAVPWSVTVKARGPYHSTNLTEDERYLKYIVDPPELSTNSHPVLVRPNITTESQKHLINTDIRMSCVVNGYLTPQIRWHKDGSALMPSERIVTEDNTLTIIKATKTDSGTYQCEAANAFSKLSNTMTILVEGISPNCTDNPFYANCARIVIGKYCHHKYYARFCCKSCTEAGL